MSEQPGFRSLGVSDAMLAALRRRGFEHPTPIQQLAIPRLLADGGDLIGQARPGSGKTAAFGIPILERCRPGGRLPQALILAPTRELVMQIAGELTALRSDDRLRPVVCCGGQDLEAQLQQLDRGAAVVVATPGRLLDLMRRGRVRWDQLRLVVLDEADEMLNLGFAAEVESILSATPATRRTVLFSATMPEPVVRLAERFLRAPERISVVGDEAGGAVPEQLYFEVRREDRAEALRRILEVEEEPRTLIFCRTRGEVEELGESLRERGLRVETLHGDLPQVQRSRVLQRFQDGRFRILVATDVAARGLDWQGVERVINYSLPPGPEAYVHRIGRAGRGGRSGVALTLVTPTERRRFDELRRALGGEFRPGRLPTDRELLALRRERCAGRLRQLIAGGEHEPYLEFAAGLLHGAEPEAVLAALLRLTFGEPPPDSGREPAPGPRRGGRGGGPVRGRSRKPGAKSKKTPNQA